MIFGKNWPPRERQRVFKKIAFFGILRSRTAKAVFLAIFLLGWSSIKFWASHTGTFINNINQGQKLSTKDRSDFEIFGDFYRNFFQKIFHKNWKLGELRIIKGVLEALFDQKNDHFCKKIAKNPKKFTKKTCKNINFLSANTRFFLKSASYCKE